MCGLSGFVCLGAGTGVSAAALRDMNACIAHRGPDGEGFLLSETGLAMENYIGRNDTQTPGKPAQWHPPDIALIDEVCDGGRVFQAGLGHRRLSIIDLTAAGHQPMSVAGSDCWLAFNGEIYNYRELRSELQAEGVKFVSESDSEVLLQAWLFWGRDCLERFNGMFAFLILDAGRNLLFAARDRFGIKPLYYWIDRAGTVFFASEIKQFTCLPGWRSRLNHQRACDFLARGLIDHNDETMFAGVHQLPPGHSLEVPLPAHVNATSARTQAASAAADSRLDCDAWYRLPEVIKKTPADEGQQAFRELLASSVQLRLRSDVPVGSCLSGGLDSSAIVALVSRQLKQQQQEAQRQGRDLHYQTPRTFSAYSDDASINEQHWVELLVQETDVEPFHITPTDEQLLEKIEQMVWHQDEPFGTTSIFAQWSVFELAANEGMRVMLDGQGADEQLMGYGDSAGVALAQMLRQGQFTELIATVRSMQQTQGRQLPELVKLAGQYFLPRFLQQRLRAALGKNTDQPGWLSTERLNGQRISARLSESPKSLAELALADMQYRSLPMLLHFEDRNSMAHSIEARVPFLDFRLVNQVMSLPVEQRFYRGLGKWVMRQGLKGVLPEPIRTRTDKIGFKTSEELWFTREPLASWLLQRVTRSVELSDGLLKPEICETAECMLRGEINYDEVLWRWVCFGLWLEAFSVDLEF